MSGWVKDVDQQPQSVGPKPPPSLAATVAACLIVAFFGAFAARFGWFLAGRFVP